jgi:Asp-tRNA(Asn)/Glu-tRNA(Gln) amidotransferase A subunit family amidase
LDGKTGSARAVTLAAALLLGGCGGPGSPDSRADAGPEVVEATSADLQAALRDGRTTCRRIVQAYLDRIDAYDQPTGLNAISMINPRALERADEIDARLAAGEEPGPLFCAPILVKDNFDTHDLPTTGGSVVLAESLPPDDAFMVRRLREADAIVLAKTNMAEWAFSPRRTESSTRGVTANAYALDRVPAGSSGGTASGVAASFGVAGMGSDTGNSIRGPSSHLALVGIRSTLGLTSRDGVIPLAFDRDIAGPMTRTVEDGARILDVVAGRDPADPLTEPGKRQVDYTAFLDPGGLEGTRIGVLRDLAEPESSDAEVLAVFEQALRDLAAAGAEIVDPVTVPEFDSHLEADPYCPRFRYDVYRYLLSLGEGAPLLDVMEAHEAGRASPYTASAFEFYGTAPLEVRPEEWPEPCPFYLEHPLRRAFHDAVLAAMDEAGVEALLYPTWTHPPAHLDRPREEYRGDNSQLVSPATGMPAFTVPMGYTRDTLPAGLQILGRRYAEGTLIRIAYAYEQATGHRQPPALFPPLAP